MLRTLALTILITLSTSTAFALTAKEVVTKGKIIAEGADNATIQVLIQYKGDLYKCDAVSSYLTCSRIDSDTMYD